MLSLRSSPRPSPSTSSRILITLTYIYTLYIIYDIYNNGFPSKGGRPVPDIVQQYQSVGLYLSADTWNSLRGYELKKTPLKYAHLLLGDCWSHLVGASLLLYHSISTSLDLLYLTLSPSKICWCNVSEKQPVYRSVSSKAFNTICDYYAMFEVLTFLVVRDNRGESMGTIIADIFLKRASFQYEMSYCQACWSFQLAYM